MAATSRGGQAVSALFHAQSRTASCARCAQTRSSPFFFSWPATSRRLYSAAAATEAEPSPSPPSTAAAVASREEPVAVSHPGFRIRAGLLLSRPPLLTREPTAFESAFYLYQKRLNERLSGSFRKNVYFKPDTTPALDWRLQLRDRRGTPARDIGSYEGGKGGHGRGGARAWDDELTLDDPLATELTQPDRLRERIISDADLRVSEDGERLSEADRVRVERPQPRTTAADGDLTTGEGANPRRLDRRLDRTLYLVVRGADGTWGFPTADVQTNENLHETAARALESAAGVDMNTWIVGRVPIAHIVQSTDATDGEKTFFLKGRIMAGQANLEGNTSGLTDFKWLTKEELAKELPWYYYSGVKHAMPER
ncbi:50S ribosomal subunit l30 [Grosmannia clavigera kw1407]|uniref:Large ribosomal subunit protein mL46 n=1 Tax=Grosmannia clavigera (strain kw1407 / UAMH 11150) TaxID=655863 RepID=F0XS76_GROCL|nr:50S ribosomal subunit l30 [Grosmannia clavigera kw1407]EFW99584.1 50S ribosomal subunit l30 [Grosmannia clavigera kw1407]